jgi:hypothetical protein
MWGPGAQGGFQNALAMGQQSGNNIMQAFQQGRQMAEQREYKNALAQFDPNKPETLDPIMQARPEVGLQLRGQVQQQQRAAQVAQLGQAAMNGNNQALEQLFTLDPDLWKRLDDRQRENVKGATSFMAQSSMAIGRLPEAQRAQAWATSVQQAEAGGIDIPAYMERYSPDVLNAALARAEMTEKYIKQFEPDFRVIPQGGYLEDVNPVTAGQQQPATQQGPQTASVPVVPTDIFQADVQSLGLQGAIRFAVSKGLAVPISGDQEYALLPSGAAFVGPDGVARRKP